MNLKIEVFLKILCLNTLNAYISVLYKSKCDYLSKEKFLKNQIVTPKAKNK